MTCHLTLAAAALVLTASTFWDPSTTHQRVSQVAYAHRHPSQPGQSFAAAFGRGGVVRNLLF